MSNDLLLRLFVPIKKIDEEQRLVYGTVASEVVDNSGEVFDYEGSKPHFEEWTKNAEATSNGLSKGNLRVMHTAKVAGKLTDIDFNDMGKTISCVAHVVDDDEWKKVQTGCYTGFSMGGRYLSKLKKDDGPTRYIAQPVEVSLVDKPCIKTAVFDYCKADGTTEHRHFDGNLLVDEAPPVFEVLDAEKADRHNLRHTDGKFKEVTVPTVEKHGGSDPTGHGGKDAKAEAAGINLIPIDPADVYKGDFADPGYQEDGANRYPVDTEAHIRAAWSYINMPKNAKAYSSEDLAKVKAKIISAWKSTIDKDGPPSAAEKSDMPYVPTNDEVLPLAKELAKADGKPDTAWLDYMVPARDQLVEKAASATAGKDQTDKTSGDSGFAARMAADKAKKDGGKADTDNVADKGAGKDSSGKHFQAGTEQTDSKPGTKAGDAPEGTSGSDTEQKKHKDASGIDDKDSKSKGGKFPFRKSDGTPQQVWTADDGEMFLAKAECLAHNEELAKAVQSPLLAALGDLGAVLKADDADTKGKPWGKHDPDNADCKCKDCTDKAEKMAAAPKIGDIRSTMADAVAKFSVFRDNELTKGMYTVSRLANLLECLESLHMSVCWEEQAEGDGSTLPASLLTGLKQLGQTLVDMATEEVNEMVAGGGKMADDSPIMALAAATMGLEKADFATKIGERLEKRDLGSRVSDPDLMQKFDALSAENASMRSELDAALPLVKSLFDEVAAWRNRPMPPAPRTNIVEKGDEARVGSGGQDLLAKYDPSDLADAAIRLSHSRGGRFFVAPPRG